MRIEYEYFRERDTQVYPVGYLSKVCALSTGSYGLCLETPKHTHIKHQNLHISDARNIKT